MIHLIVTDALHDGLLGGGAAPGLIAMRSLSRQEVRWVRSRGVRRFYLEPLSPADQDAFLAELDRFWLEATAPFGPDHRFWRNAVSSKLQEWAESAVYLALVLFSLARKRSDGDLRLVILCGSVQEEDLGLEWGRRQGWAVARRCQSPWPGFVRRCLQGIRNAVVLAWGLRVSLAQQPHARRAVAGFRLRDESVLIGSLFYGKSLQDGKYRDPFFETLHEFLADHGERAAYLCWPLNRVDAELARRIARTRDVPVFPVHGLVSRAAMIAIALRLLVSKIDVPTCRFQGVDFSALLTWNARRFRNPSNNMAAEIVFAATRALCSRHPFARLILNFEGSTIERACIQAYRHACGGEVLGYCQGVIYPLNLKLRRSPGEEGRRPDPDRYVCNGPISKELFERVGNRRPEEIRPGCSVRDIPALTETPVSGGSKQILVALDGVGTAANLLDWVLDAAPGLRDFRFVIRAHPNVPLSELIDPADGLLPDNVCASSGSLEEDLRESLCVLYRSSSVGLQGLINGVPAVHLAVDSPLPCDPISRIEVGKWVARTPEELRRALAEIEALTADARRDLRARASRLARDYFASPTDERHADFLADGSR
jgi:hypothetical protein